MTVSLHHVIAGPEHGPVLVLGNSLGTDTKMWDRLLAELGERFRVLRFDHRGQGSSPVPPGPYTIDDLGQDLLALLDELEVERASYCGVSVGGMVGLWLAAHAPEHLERLVVCCTSAYLGNPEVWQERAAAVSAAGSTALIADAVVARWLTPGYASQHPDIVSELRSMLVASPPEGYVACCAVLEHVDLRADLERIRAPTLVISGAGDAAIPPDQGQRIAEQLQDARYELLDPGAHIPMVERPDAVARLLLGWLDNPR
jgi:3-oxoadipate enol-lactonase